jgi:hypothetical protein
VIKEWKMNIAYFTDIQKNKNNGYRYVWSYLVNSTLLIIPKLTKMAKREVPQSDWVNGNIWGMPKLQTAPPLLKFSARVRDALLALNIGADQYYGFKTDEFRWAIIYPPP